jgi:predicted ATPase/DNA-binding SARP family transcriptional activator
VAGVGQLRYRVLGTIELVDDDGAPVPVRSARQRALLAVLCLHAGRVVTADALVDVLWGDDVPADPSAALQTHVHRLRRLLPEGALEHRLPGYVLRVAPGELDTERLTAAVADAAARRADDPAGAVAVAEAALGLVVGTPSAELADVDAFRGDVARLDELRVRAQEERLAGLVALGRADDAVTALERLVADEPLRERPRALLVEALARAGRVPDALDAYQGYRRTLAEELGLEPSEGLRALERAVLDGSLPPLVHDGRSVAAPTVAPGSAVAPGRAPSGSTRRPSLPVTTFVGREVDVARVVELLGRVPLVTLTGPGGVGKTRLALHVADAVAGRFPGGVVVCELAAVDVAASVAPAVAAALGVDDQGGAALVRRIAEAVADRPTLVVLDNCEHVLDGAAPLAEHLARVVGGSAVLATSRERLGADGEHVWPVEPLASGAAGSLDGAPAVTLLVDRARAVRPGFAPDGADAAAVAEICRRLDGLPLAIELAAARLGALSPAEVVDGLDDRFRLLRTGRRTADPRQQSLRAVIDWSFARLGSDEQGALAALAVFADGFSLAGAAAVTGWSVDEARDVVTSLVDRSLVVERRQGSSTRYSLLETVREYGLDHLDATNGLATARRRASDHLLALAKRADEGVRGPDAATWLAVLDVEQGNLRAVHHALVDDGEVGPALRLSWALHWWAFDRARQEVFGWAETAVAMPGAGGHPACAAALGSAATGAWQRGDLDRAVELAERGIAVVPDGHPASTIPHASLGDTLTFLGRGEEAVHHHRRASEVALAGGDRFEAAIERASVASTATYFGLDAGGAIDEALVFGRESGSPLAQGFVQYCLGEVLAPSDADGAEAALRRAVALEREIGGRFLAGVAGVTLVSLAVRRDDPRVAAAATIELLDDWLALDAPTQLVIALRTVAELLHRLGRPADAAVLVGAVTAPGVAPVSGGDAERLRALRVDLGVALGADRCDHAVAAGHSLVPSAAAARAVAALRDALAPG